MSKKPDILPGAKNCPYCGAMPHKLYKNFCAKCGADMRGIQSETRK